MDVIPVLDLKGGRAVHARRGERAAYAAVRGALGPGDDPVALAAAFRDTLGRRRLYLADLDALAGAGDARPRVAALAALGLELWVDAGARSPADAAALLASGAGRAILALETLPGMHALRPIVAALGAQRTAFSLDLRDGRPLAADPALSGADPVDVAREAAAAGIDALLVIDLAAVGAEAGPREPLLRRLRAALPGVRLVAGGGVRDVRDLQALAALGCDAALVATALHSGRIGRWEIESVEAIRRT